ncbi:hypothetical protein FQN54_009394 [Arachnomyces sp. PD_36]|nr:hypothetical protein FQN54_009394 [Arachnomyces sp. PD_36]
MFTFTPLLGAQSESSKASQSILELDGGVKILIDVGWDENFDPAVLNELEKQIPTLSLILLTHATPAHIGAFAHCCKTFPLFTQIPVYATNPVISLGRTLLQDLYASAPVAATFLPTASIAESASLGHGSGGIVDASSSGSGKSNGILLPPPSTEDIARYFSLIHPLKYSQPHQPLPSPFSPPLNGLTLTAYNAGHTVGGTLWHIQHGMESIVYAVDWNQARENVIAGAAWFGGSGARGTEVIEQLRKPTALVCSSKGGDKFALPGGRKKRDEILLDMVRSSVAKGGTVLIPSDSSARVLELAYVLEHAWREAAESPDGENALKGANLCLAGKKAHGTMRLARSMLEWMDESIVREFESGDGGDPATADRPSNRTDNQQMRNGSSKKGGPAKSVGPFTFKHLKIIEQKGKLAKALASGKPQVILASDSSLDWGFSKDTLLQMAGGPDNLIIMTESFSRHPNVPDTAGKDQLGLGHTIWKWYEERTDGVALEKASDGELLEQVHTGGRTMSVTNVQQLPLDQNEQLLYQQYLATQRQLQNTAQGRSDANLEAQADALDDGSSSSESEDDDSEQQGKVLNFSVSLAHSNRSKLGLSDADLGVNILLRRKNVYDYDVRGKKGRERMFPYVAPKKRGDEYGEFIRPEEYLRAEEREEADAQAQRGPNALAESSLGQKRKWGEMGPNGKWVPSGENKRHQASRGADKRRPGSSGDMGSREEMVVERTEDVESSEDEADVQASTEGPSKANYTSVSIQMNARIAFVDFAGLHDKRSLEMLIPLIHPRKLILVGGMKEETMALAAECRNLLAAKVGLDVASSQSTVDIFTPLVGETVDASVDTNAWMVKLSNNLVRRLKWQNVKNLGVVTLSGELRGPEALAEDDNSVDSPNKKQKTLKAEPESAPAPVTSLTVAKKDTFPVLEVLPQNMTVATRSVTRPLHVGDLRLADLRKLMQTAGHTAEFRGEGTLLIDGLVAVRKSKTGKIEVEGAALSAVMNPLAMGRNEGSFLAVKKKIYEGLAVVAGG